MAERPQIIGPDSGPEPPFPLRMGGQVVSGFGRGSKEVCVILYLFHRLQPLPLLQPTVLSEKKTEGGGWEVDDRESTTYIQTVANIPQLGIPTANIPVEGVSWIETAESGVYFGWAGIQLPPSHPDLTTANHASTAPSINPTTANPSPQSTVYPSAPSPPPSALEAGWR